MNEAPKKHKPFRLGPLFRRLFHRRTQGRVLIGLATLITLVAMFYLEEDWRGKHDWEKCKVALEAKGEVLDWNAYIPPPVPADQNFFNAPKMTQWFVGRGQSGLSKRLRSANENLTTSVSSGTNNLITTAKMAQNYLAWSDQFEPDFNLIRKALNRPYARMDGDYAQPLAVPIPNFLTVREVAQTLAQRAHCFLLLNEPDKALQELTLMHDFCRLLEGAPTGKPVTLVAAMINVAVTGLYAETIAEGFHRHTWRELQLAALQKQLKGTDLLPIAASAFKMQLAATILDYKKKPAELAGLYLLADAISDNGSASDDTASPTFWWCLKNPMYLLLKFAPSGWRYQNMVYSAVLESKSLAGFDLEHDTLSPKIFDQVGLDMKQLHNDRSPFRLLAAIVIPNTVEATQTLAYDQTMVNEARIACALERYRLAYSAYPKTLDSLVPQFIKKLPHDIIGGQPLHYRRTTDGKFLLYSVGWNEKDDGGKPGTLSNPKQGDWVWQYPAK